MRVLIVLVALAILLALIGWITVNNEPNRSSINIEKEEIQEDTREMLEAGNDLIDRARGSVDDSTTEGDMETRVEESAAANTETSPGTP
jgi:hypothetical protein